MRILISALSLASCLVVLPAAANTTEGFVPGADAVRIHYLQAGPADAAHTLLLIPGWRVSASIWSAQLDDFSSRGYRVIAIDSRSQGESSVVQSGNAPEDRARDIQAIIAGLQLTHLTLVGWSQGAQDVAAYVSQFGTGSLEHLALVDSPVSAGAGDVTAQPAYVKIELDGIALYSRHPAEYSDGMMHAIISTPAPAETFTHLVQESMHTPSDIGISMLLQDQFTVDRRPALKKFDKPTLIIASAASPLLDSQQAMLAALPRGKFIAVKHASHAVFFDQPEEFDRLMEDFINGRASGAM